VLLESRKQNSEFRITEFRFRLEGRTSNWPAILDPLLSEDITLSLPTRIKLIALTPPFRKFLLLFSEFFPRKSLSPKAIPNC
jgi:hypothetical protein